MWSTPQSGPPTCHTEKKMPFVIRKLLLFLEQTIYGVSCLLMQNPF